MIVQFSCVSLLSSRLPSFVFCVCVFLSVLRYLSPSSVLPLVLSLSFPPFCCSRIPINGVALRSEPRPSLNSTLPCVRSSALDIRICESSCLLLDSSPPLRHFWLAVRSYLLPLVFPERFIHDENQERSRWCKNNNARKEMKEPARRWDWYENEEEVAGEEWNWARASTCVNQMKANVTCLKERIKKATKRVHDFVAGVERGIPRNGEHYGGRISDRINSNEAGDKLHQLK